MVNFFRIILLLIFSSCGQQYDRNGNKSSGAISNSPLYFSALANGFDCKNIAQTMIPESECLALKEFYIATDGDNWSGVNDWWSDKRVEEWSYINGFVNGVEIPSTGHVTHLVFDNIGLKGEIPSSIQNLTQLEYLSIFNPKDTFGNNGIGGAIPDALCTLNKLNILELTGNFQGEIPECIGNLINLKDLNLSHSGFDGVIPSSIGNLVNLKLMDFSFNKLSGTIPQSIGNLKVLRWLYLAENNLEGELPHSIGSMSALEKLSLYNNRISGEIPIEFGNLGNLQYFTARDNKITKIPDSLSGLKKVTSFDLSNNQISSELPGSIGSLKSLVQLNLSNNAIPGILPNSIGNLTNLVELNLSRNSFTGEISNTIGNLKKLKELKLSYAGFSGIPKTIGNCSALEILYLDNNKFSGTVPNELGMLTNLQGLGLNSNQISEIPNTFANLKSLYSLNLSYNNLTGPIPQFLYDMNNLVILSLDHNSLTGSISSSIEKMTNLSQLAINKNQIQGVIPDSISNLKNLSAFWGMDNYLSGDVPLKLIQKNLTTLNLNNNCLTTSGFGPQNHCVAPVNPDIFASIKYGEEVSFYSTILFHPTTSTIELNPNLGSAYITVDQLGNGILHYKAPLATGNNSPDLVIKIKVVNGIFYNTITVKVSNGGSGNTPTPTPTSTASNGGGSTGGGSTGSGSSGGNTPTATPSPSPSPSPSPTTGPLIFTGPSPIEVSKTGLVSASGGKQPYSFSIVSGGGELNNGPSSFTKIFKAPASAGTVVLKVSDSSSPKLEKTLTIIISAVPVPLVLNGPSSNQVEALKTFQFSATGGSGPYTFSIVAGGIGSINSSTGLYTAPATSGTAIIKVVDSTLPTPLEKTLGITIISAPLKIIGASNLLPSASSVYSVSGGKPPYTYTINPAGVGSVSAGAPVNGVVPLTYTAPCYQLENVDLIVSDSDNKTSMTSVKIAFTQALALAPATAEVFEDASKSFTASYLDCNSAELTLTPNEGSVTRSGNSIIYTAPMNIGAPSKTIIVKVSQGSRIATTSIVVKELIDPPLTIATANNVTTVVNGASLGITASGGRAPLTFSSSGASGGSLNCSGNQCTFIAALPVGQKVITVTDKKGRTESVTLNVVPNIICPSGVLSPITINNQLNAAFVSPYSGASMTDGAVKAVVFKVPSGATWTKKITINSIPSINAPTTMTNRCAESASGVLYPGCNYASSSDANFRTRVDVAFADRVSGINYSAWGHDPSQIDIVAERETEATYNYVSSTSGSQQPFVCSGGYCASGHYVKWQRDFIKDANPFVVTTLYVTKKLSSDGEKILELRYSLSDPDPFKTISIGHPCSKWDDNLEDYVILRIAGKRTVDICGNGNFMGNEGELHQAGTCDGPNKAYNYFNNQTTGNFSVQIGNP